jgi:molecular chaperone GrpE
VSFDDRNHGAPREHGEHGEHSEHDEHGEAGPVIRDKRRIDPVTGELREPRQAAPASTGPPDGSGTAAAGDTSGLEAQLAERTADLQRLQAEYVNYKRRVDRDREVVRDTAVAGVLGHLLPVLDDIGRAREHDELTGGFKAVAESLERTVTSLGLEKFGAVGDPFDPRVHEALMHRHTDDVAEPVCEAVLQVGYRLGERIVRPARVAVAEPESYSPEPAEFALTDDEPAADRPGSTADQTDSDDESAASPR